ncbi:MAG TPA: LacI family DNA-binding transcriptional regulator [Candidatus Atribacteria bacterium]|nr:LacI family DNA-binding transcriptional regulator [Candidatus Atribacteria bacterium]HPT77548.1 LacI family DNA-binding transcriptional regulator [Candidatus Atribacteria bacterium]
MKKQVTIKDIAKLAGVSVATVSRVINGNGRYSKDTEERVLRIIKEHNYSPNMLGKGLRTNKTNTIGIVVPDITNEFFARIIQEVEKNLFRAGYTTLVCNTSENPELEKRYLEVLNLNRVSGTIYIAGDTRVKHEEPRGIPAVYIDRWPSTTRKDIVFIESDNFEGGRLAAQEMLKCGCRRIIFLTDERRTSAHQSRCEGYIRAHREFGVVPDERFIIGLSEISFDAAYNEVIRLIDNNVKFDGIFASTDWLALGSLVALESRGIKVPEQVKIVGFDNISISKHCSTPITTINQNVTQMGELAVDLLLKLIDGKEIDKKYYVLPVELVKRSTT